MFRSLWRPQAKKPIDQTRRVKLNLESLESRDCPTAAYIASFMDMPASGNMVHLSGVVSGDNHAGVSMSFGGVVSAQAVTDASGFFSVQALASSAGTIIAQALGPNGGVLDSAATEVTNAAPSLTLNIAYGTQRSIILSGQVFDENPGGRTVTFSGVASGSTVTNADGTYFIQLQANSLGAVNASTTDQWGVASNIATVNVVSNAPQIADASVTEEINNMWTLRGRVIDESAPNLVISFAGLPSVAGRTVTVESNGWFCFVIQLQPNEEGTVTGTTTDWWGQQSNTACWNVYPTT